MSELSQISTLNTTQDVNKQLAYIRSYLIQLKDEIESELNNVTYDMLSADLKKRISMINDDIVVQGDEKQNGDLVVESLIARYASISRLVATLGEIQTLTSQLATIGELIVATKATADEVVARLISATGSISTDGKITAASASILGNATINGVLNCGLLKTTGFEVGTTALGEVVSTMENVHTDSINPTTGNTLSISGGNNAQSGDITMGTGRFNSIQVFNGSGYDTLTLKNVTGADGNTYQCLGK